MPALETFAANQLAESQQKSRYRVLKETRREADGWVIREGKRLLSFSCNDYLGLSHHPKVIAAAREAAEKYGAGAGASRLVTGNHPLYTRLEAQLAALKGTESAMVFGSGYMANIGVIPALVGKGDLILADKFVHACLLDGATLSGAKLLRFSHNKVAHLAELLTQHRAQYRHALILTDSIFSMDGDRAPLAELSALAKIHDAWLMVDDAHGLGITQEKDGNLAGDAHIDIAMGTLSKAAGSYGGYVCAKAGVVDYLRNSARSFIYTTGLPPMVVAAASAALEIIAEDKALTAKPLANARLFTSALGLPEAESAVVPLILGEEQAALSAAVELEAAGFLVAAIRPPTVPPGSARLRFAFSASHREEDIQRLAEFIKGVLKIHNL